jgi:hypothetical protein
MGPEDNPLAGLPLRYLIGTDLPGPGVEGEIVESSYDVDTLRPHGISIAYCNLFDEKMTGKYGSYLHDSDTAADYGEGQIDWRGPGFEKNLKLQLMFRASKGFKYVELDNPDAYPLHAVMRAINLADFYNLKVVAKNPGLGCAGIDADPILAHRNVCGIIVEKGAGTPASMNAMRCKAQRPQLPVWFVFFGSGRLRCITTSNAIKAGEFANMGATYSPRGEYGASLDYRRPNDFS